MSTEKNTSNEEFMDEKLLTYKRRRTNTQNPNHPEVSNAAATAKRKGKDIGWKHGEMLNGLKQHWRCNYCGLVRHGGGVTRLKLHLVGHTDVRKCPNVPDHVVHEITANLRHKGQNKSRAAKPSGKRNKTKKRIEESDEDSSSYSQSESYGTDYEEEMSASADLEAGASGSGRDENKWESWRCVLENMLSSGSEDGGVHSCILRALSSRTGTGNLLKQEEGSGGRTVEKCKEALVNTLISDKFAALCDLLGNSFRDGNSEGKNRQFFDFSEIDAKLKHGDYERSPQMFIRDLRKLWETFERVGREMLRVANSLSVISTNNIETEVGIRVKPNSQKPTRTKPDPTRTCNHCRTELTPNWGVINCNGCNTGYHKSCINPLIINPSNNHWYCSSCMAQNLHHDSYSDSDDVRDSDSVQPCITAIYKLCKICGGKEEEDKEFLICAHPECPYKYYHTKCLTRCMISSGTQIRETGYCWYCPSCLCRVCLRDKDDSLIVLCDGCDEAYHIYCMDPVRESVPEGKWFCGKCGTKRKREKGKRRNNNNGPLVNNNNNNNYNNNNNNNGGRDEFYKPEVHRPLDLLLKAAEALNDKEKEL